MVVHNIDCLSFCESKQNKKEQKRSNIIKRPLLQKAKNCSIKVSNIILDVEGDNYEVEFCAD